MRKALPWIVFVCAVSLACGPASPPRSATDAEFTESPLGVFFTENRGTITIEGGSNGGTISMDGGGGTWTMKSPGVMEVTINGQTQEVPFSRAGGMDLTVTFPGQAPEVWTGQ